MSPLHRLVLVHVERAAHKRRHLPTFACQTMCNLEDHGPSPMSLLVSDDTYGMRPISIAHSADVSPLAHAIALARGEESTLTVGVLDEASFEDPDAFDLHRSAVIAPGRDGVTIAVIHADVDHKETADDEAAREDLLRASGYSMYLVDLRSSEDAAHMHRRLALLLEDVFDECIQIKADAAARILTVPPLWPALVIRTTPEWRAAHPMLLTLPEGSPRP